MIKGKMGCHCLWRSCYGFHYTASLFICTPLHVHCVTHLFFAIKVLSCLAIPYASFPCSHPSACSLSCNAIDRMVKGQDREEEPLLGVLEVASSYTTPTNDEETRNLPHDLTTEEKVIEKQLVRKLDTSLLLWAQVFHLL